MRAHPVSYVYVHTPMLVHMRMCTQCMCRSSVCMGGSWECKRSESARQEQAAITNRIERDCMRALNGVLDLVSWLGLDL